MICLMKNKDLLSSKVTNGIIAVIKLINHNAIIPIIDIINLVGNHFMNATIEAIEVWGEK